MQGKSSATEWYPQSAKLVLKLLAYVESNSELKKIKKNDVKNTYYLSYLCNAKHTTMIHFNDQTSQILPGLNHYEGGGLS